MKRIVVCGGRAYRDKELLHDALVRYHLKVGIGLLAAGDAGGADHIAVNWAVKNQIAFTVFRTPDKLIHSFGVDKADNIRNKTMLEVVQPELVIAFPGGQDTASMRELARINQTPVWQPEEEDWWPHG